MVQIIQRNQTNPFEGISNLAKVFSESMIKNKVEQRSEQKKQEQEKNKQMFEIQKMIMKNALDQEKITKSDLEAQESIAGLQAEREIPNSIIPQKIQDILQYLPYAGPAINLGGRFLGGLGRQQKVDDRAFEIMQPVLEKAQQQFSKPQLDLSNIASLFNMGGAQQPAVQLGGARAQSPTQQTYNETNFEQAPEFKALPKKDQQDLKRYYTMPDGNERDKLEADLIKRGIIS